MMKQKRLLFMSIGFVVLIGIFGIVLALSGGTSEEIQSIEVEKNGQTLRVNKDGSVFLKTPDGEYQDQWGDDKVKAFFGYFDGKVFEDGEFLLTFFRSNGSQDLFIGEDELINIVIDETSGGGSGDGGEGNDVGDFFGDDGGTGTNPGGGSTNPTPPPGGGGGDEDDDECLFWRVSYCVEFPPIPTPSPTPTEAPVEIKPADCAENTETGRTVISSELCLPTPSPTPTP